MQYERFLISSAAKRLSSCHPLEDRGIRTAVHRCVHKIVETVLLVRASWTSQIVECTNRKIKQTGLLLSQENGGLSGRPLQKKANQIIKHIHSIDKKIILIGVGGIDSPESAWERICSGASLIQLYTGWIYKGPQLVPDILQGIIKQLNIHKLSNIKEAIGSDLKWIE